MTTSSITYTRLNSGDWGLRGYHLEPGAVVRVARKSGDSKAETVGRVVWRGPDGLCLATIGRASGYGRSSSRRSSGSSWDRRRETFRRRYGWDGVEGSASYYSSGLYDEES